MFQAGLVLCIIGITLHVALKAMHPPKPPPHQNSTHMSAKIIWKFLCCLIPKMKRKKQRFIRGSLDVCNIVSYSLMYNVPRILSVWCTVLHVDSLFLRDLFWISFNWTYKANTKMSTWQPLFQFPQSICINDRSKKLATIPQFSYNKCVTTT